jgi:hypothetical protein
MPLEGVPADRWVVFDRVLAARDVFTGGGRTFANEADARAFRADIYALYGAALRRALLLVFAALSCHPLLC